MSFERQPCQSPVRLEYLKEIAQNDGELGELYEGIISAIDDYVLIKIKNVRLAENVTARYSLAEKYEAKLEDSDTERYEAHNRLIKLLVDFAARSRILGQDTAWWDGPDGLSQDSERQSSRRHIDDWATDIFIENEEAEKSKKHISPSKKGRRQSLQTV